MNVSRRDTLGSTFQTQIGINNTTNKELTRIRIRHMKKPSKQQRKTRRDTFNL